MPLIETANCFEDGWKPRLEKILDSWETYLDSLSQSGASKGNIVDAQKNIKQLQGMLKYSRHNVLYANREVQRTITHEFGHVLADQLCGQINHRMANPTFAHTADNPLGKSAG